MRHPSPAALLDLHFGESEGARDGVRSHVHQCPLCSAQIEEMGLVERALVLGPDDGPPPDGLERVLARVSTLQPAQARRAGWVRVVAPSAAAMAAGAWAVCAGASWLTTLGVAPHASAGPLPAELLVLSLAALGVLAVGALLTLAVAPVLILESHGRSY